MSENSYIPIIGNSMLYPIIDLFEKIEDVKGPNEVQASSYENGYSAAIILLSYVMLESY